MSGQIVLGWEVFRERKTSLEYYTLGNVTWASCLIMNLFGMRRRFSGWVPWRFPLAVSPCVRGVWENSLTFGMGDGIVPDSPAGCLLGISNFLVESKRFE